MPQQGINLLILLSQAPLQILKWTQNFC